MFLFQKIIIIGVEIPEYPNVFLFRPDRNHGSFSTPKSVSDGFLLATAANIQAA